MLMTKIRSLEKESGVKSYRGDRDKTHDDLRSKLKAAESLCETLMDENEDMKKEIRQLEEEIYEMQDNFRYYILFFCIIKNIKNIYSIMHAMFFFNVRSKLFYLLVIIYHSALR